MVIARIETFILEKSLEDALKRAVSYSKAGADAIGFIVNLIALKKFLVSKNSKNKYFKPMVDVPSTYSKTS